MKRWFPRLQGRCALVVAGFGLLVAAAPVALADGAPAPAQPGSSPRAGTVPTNVRMVAEEVVLRIEQAEMDSRLRPGAQMVGRVGADFTMRNLGDRTESLEVWFPIHTGYPIPYGPRETPPPELAIGGDFAAWVDGVSAALERREVVEPTATPGSRAVYDTYAVWNATFPPGRDVAMRVTYSTRPTARGPLGTFGYVLDTGAGWRDSIGEVSVTFRLPYDVTDVNTVLASEGIDNNLRPNPAGYVVSGTDVTWRMSDLEPDASDNPRLTVLSPGIWRRILEAREATVREPGSAQAEVALAAALAEGVLYGSGMGVVWAGGEGRELWQQADAAYRRALELAPDDLDIHLRYLEMLWRDCTVCDATSAPPNFVTTLNHASALAPANPTVLYYESQLEAGGTASAAYFATATQEAIRPSITTTPRAAVSTTASVPTALPGVAARRGLPTPTTWIQPIATSVVPGTVQAGSAGQRRDAPVAVAGVLLVAIGLAAWAYRRHG